MNNITRSLLLRGMRDVRERELKKFRDNIRARRGATHQAVFANYIGVHIRSVSDWESGKTVPSLDALHVLANKLGDSSFLDAHQHAKRTTHNTVQMLVDLSRLGIGHSDIADELGASSSAVTKWRAGGAMTQGYYMRLKIMWGERTCDT